MNAQCWHGEMKSLRHAVKRIKNRKLRNQKRWKNQECARNQGKNSSHSRVTSHVLCSVTNAPPLEHNKRHYASLGHRFIGFSTRSGLRPNWFLGVPGNSDWDSAALTFSEIFSIGLRQFASTRLHCTLRVWATGSVLTTSPKSSRFGQSSKPTS